MSARVKLISGLHITAADKRNIVAVIEHMASLPSEERLLAYYGKPSSLKSYAVLPDPEACGRYSVSIKTRERDDFGRKQSRSFNIVVEVQGTEQFQTCVRNPQSELNL